ncbi:glycosyltransferase [Emticicia sp. 21SJ11W-3]|uniref:glycosyltransferase n=1 Tax=Emticicia sp. 21SJ11W-3 TaxID=2916755 RepID=UPI00209CB07B|nr:glycosyltransferase [Emticicia sp. 21SJ11W-3]UTA66439.1 glycosyltransferase [Emticicia sp. 21SJ11W-3]
MNIAILSNSVLPVTKYGGTERIIWWLGEELTKMGHKVTFIAPEGTKSSFAKVIHYNPEIPLARQIPEETDIVHLYEKPKEPLSKPYIVMIQGNKNDFEACDENTVFVSRNHAERYGSDAFVYNGLKLEEYGKPDFKVPRTHLHFLAKAAWRVKNVKGAISIARASGNKLAVLGGTRLNIKMGFRFTPYPSISFYGMIGGEEKNQLLRTSKGLVFPVLWHEPFGIAIIESMYMGSPVFGTPYGSLPELVPAGMGVLSDKKSVLIEALADVDSYDNKRCSEYVADNFTMAHTTRKYIEYYETVLNGRKINPTPPKLKEMPPKFLPFYE